MANVEYIISLRDKFSKKLGSATKAISKLDQKVNKLTPSIGGLGKQLAGLASVAAIGAVFVSTAKDVAQYEENIASLSAITGATGKTLEGFETQIGLVAKETKGSSVEIAKAFELVGSAKPELLKSAEALGAVTKASIILSKASGEALETSVQSLTGTLNQFGLGAESSIMVIDTLAAGAKEGAAAVPLITQSLDKFGTVAASMNLNVADSVGLIETLAEKNIKGAEAGTSLRNVLIKMSTLDALPPEAIKQLDKFGVNASIVTDKTLPLTDRLKELGKISGDSTALFKVFGAENLVAGKILLDNVDKVAKYTEAVSKSGVAQEQYDKNTNTLNARLEQLGNAWTNIFTSSTQVGGALGFVKNAVVFLTDNLSTIVKVIGVSVGLFVAFEAAMVSATVVTTAMGVASGFATFLMGGSAMALRSNAVAMHAYKIAAGISAAAQWVWNTALSAGAASMAILGIPILAVVAGIALLVAGIVAFKNNWDNIANADGFVNTFLAVGATISDMVLMPLQKILEIVDEITGTNMAQGIEDIRNKMGISGAESTEDKAFNKAIQSTIKAADNRDLAMSEIDRLAGIQSVRGLAAKNDPLGRSGLPIAPSATTPTAKKTSITSSAPKTINLTIGSLIEEMSIHSANLTEGTEDMADKMKQALLGMLNDVQSDLG